MKKKILIIEDEKGIADTLIYALNQDGYFTVWTTTGTEGLQILSENEINVIILDIGLPDMDGFEILRQIRKISNVPVLFLTARKDEIDKVVGLELGADDYITKPFSPRELTARVKAILRRVTGTHDKETSKSNPFDVDTEKFCIRYFGKKLSLSRYEFKILKLLSEKPGWVFPREKIMDLIWEEPEESLERTVDTHIKTIRAKLKAVKPGIDPIITHRGVGYSLAEKISEAI